MVYPLISLFNTCFGVQQKDYTILNSLEYLFIFLVALKRALVLPVSQEQILSPTFGQVVLFDVGGVPHINEDFGWHIVDRLKIVLARTDDLELLICEVLFQQDGDWGQIAARSLNGVAPLCHIEDVPFHSDGYIHLEGRCRTGADYK